MYLLLYLTLIPFSPKQCYSLGEVHEKMEKFHLNNCFKFLKDETTLFKGGWGSSLGGKTTKLRGIWFLSFLQVSQVLSVNIVHARDNIHD